MNLGKTRSTDHHSRNQHTVDNTSRGHIYIFDKLMWKKLLKKYESEQAQHVVRRTTSLEHKVKVSAVNSDFHRCNSEAGKNVAQWNNQTRNMISHDTLSSLTKRQLECSSCYANCTDSLEALATELVDSVPLPNLASARGPLPVFSRSKSVGESRAHYSGALPNASVSVIQHPAKQQIPQKKHHPVQSSDTLPSRNKGLTGMNAKGGTSPKKGRHSLSPTRISSGSAFYTSVVAEQQEAKNRRLFSERSCAKESGQQPMTDFREKQDIINGLFLFSALFFWYLCA